MYRVIFNLDNLEDNFKNRVVALGFFDGFHKGHQFLINKAINIAKEIKSEPLILTMTRSFSKVKEQRVLTTIDEKVFLLKELFDLDKDFILFMEKVETIYNMDAYEFIYKLLKNPFKAKALVCGKDFKFGKYGKGDINLLKSLTKGFDFFIEIVDFIKYNNDKVSSSFIKRLIKEGNLEFANKLLGYNYLISGVITKGKGISSKLGFPTANLKIDKDKLLPLNGVYSCKVKLDNKLYLGALNIMKNIVEVHLINFSGYIYNKKLFVFVKDKIRDIQNFKSRQEAKKIISDDIKIIINKCGGTYVS